jgi:hypothetical protein
MQEFTSIINLVSAVNLGIWTKSPKKRRHASGMQTGFIGDEMNPVQITANTRENAEISRKRIPFPLCSTTAPVACGPAGRELQLVIFRCSLSLFVTFCYNPQRFCCLSLPFVAL